MANILSMRSIFNVNVSVPQKQEEVIITMPNPSIDNLEPITGRWLNEEGGVNNIADSIGSATDVAPADPTKAGSIIGVLKGIWATLISFLTTSFTVTVAGSLIKKGTALSVTANTDILGTTYTAASNMSSTLMIMTDTVGTLSLKVDGVLGLLNSGSSLDTGKWYAFDVPIINASTYNLQFSVGATMQIKWIGGI
jgi:hypothetical protein